MTLEDVNLRFNNFYRIFQIMARLKVTVMFGVISAPPFSTADLLMGRGRSNWIWIFAESVACDDNYQKFQLRSNN